MTERTDKPPQKAGRKPPRKHAARTRAPEGKRTKAPDARPPAKASDVAPPPGAGGSVDRSSLAPDPATVVFGSNRPIAATPPKLPDGSGLRFSGPSAGMLKASGPQPTSPKASGLTFTSAKPVPTAAAKPSSPAKPNSPAKSSPAAKPAAATRAEPSKREPGKAGAEGVEAKMPPLTKPAIAPQVAAPRFGKERSTGGFVGLMLALALVGGGLAFWMKLESETPPAPAAPQLAATGTTQPDAVAPEPVATAEPETETAQPVTAAENAAAEAAPVPSAPLGEAFDQMLAAELSPAEIGEIQKLLRFFDLGPGRADGVLTAATTDAIRTYQEMAGLPADGKADRALLDELRSVAALYGS